MTRDIARCLVALAAYAAFYGAFFWKSLASGNYIAPSDSLDFGVAAYLSAPAIWTDGMYSGYPIAADPQSLTWYPVLRLLRFVGADWNIFLVSAFVIASTTAFLFVRRLTGSNLAGALGGFTYGFSGVMLGHIGHFNQIHAAAWVPLTLYGLQVAREGHHRAGTAAAAAGFALLWFAGHPQLAVYAVYLTGGLVAGQLFIDRPPRRVAFARVGTWMAALGIGIALAAITVLPMLELGQLSARSEASWSLYVSKALPPRQLLGFLVPFAFGDFWYDGSVPVRYFGTLAQNEATAYVGMLPIALALIAGFAATDKRRELRLWLGVLIVAVLICLGDATPVGSWFYHAPGYARFRVPARHLFLTSLCLAVISSLAFSELTRRREGWTRIAIANVLAGLLAVGGFVALVSLAPEARRALDDVIYARWVPGWPLAAGGLLALGAGCVRLTGRGAVGWVAGASMLVGLHVTELTIYHYRNAGVLLRYADVARAEAVPHPRIAELRDEMQRTGERILAADGSKNPFLRPNLPRAWELPAASGSGSLSLAHYSQLLRMGGPGDVDPDTLSVEHRGLDLFSVRYAMVRTELPLAEEMKSHPERWSPVQALTYDDGDPETAYTLFKNERALPRAWGVSTLVVLERGEALDAVRTGRLPRDRGEYRPDQMALIEDDLQGWQAALSPARPTVVAQHASRRYLVTSETQTMLVLSEVYHPWWRASVDDVDAEVARVNHAMVGVVVPPGAHVVRLRLRPWSVWIGGAVSLLTLVLGLGLVATTRPRGWVALSSSR